MKNSDPHQNKVDKQAQPRNSYSQKQEFPDDSLPEDHPVILLDTGLKFLHITILFVFASVILGAIVIYTTSLTWSDPVMILFPIAGVIAGSYFAIRILRSLKHKDFDHKLKSSADISELTKDKEKPNENKSTFV
ncbi:MAG: hypothetical protein IPM74_16300 [Crocinitomicaceae bacterium]|nr:hypothetical protein [Crocinitomicaceae bacterium]MBK8927411.1 hypothetical protein [Crocinitomicaceae bacterium]